MEAGILIGVAAATGYAFYKLIDSINATTLLNALGGNAASNKRNGSSRRQRNGHEAGQNENPR